MSESNCLDDDMLFTLVDEPESAAAAAAHVTACASCAARKREVEQTVADMRGEVDPQANDAFIERLRAKMHEPPRRSRARFVYGAATVLALAAAVLLGPNLSRSGTFTPRGAALPVSAPRQSRQVELSLDVVTRPAGAPLKLTAAAADTTTPRDAHLLLSYGTRAVTVKTFVLCFAVDGAGDVHWLYPAYEDVASDPPSVELGAGRELRAMPTEALLDEVPAGAVRVFALVSTEPLHVSDIEPLTPSELERSNLERRFPGADVRTWNLALARSTK